MPQSLWCEHGEVLSDSTGLVAQKDSACMNGQFDCLIAEIQPPQATMYSGRILINGARVGIQCTVAFLSLTHAAREYRRKQRTFLMSCFNPCKSHGVFLVGCSAFAVLSGISLRCI